MMPVNNQMGGNETLDDAEEGKGFKIGIGRTRAEEDQAALRVPSEQLRRPGGPVSLSGRP